MNDFFFSKKKNTYSRTMLAVASSEFWDVGVSSGVSSAGGGWSFWGGLLQHAGLFPAAEVWIGVEAAATLFS